MPYCVAYFLAKQCQIYQPASIHWAYALIFSFVSIPIFVKPVNYTLKPNHFNTPLLPWLGIPGFRKSVNVFLKIYQSRLEATVPPSKSIVLSFSKLWSASYSYPHVSLLLPIQLPLGPNVYLINCLLSPFFSLACWHSFSEYYLCYKQLVEW